MRTNWEIVSEVLKLLGLKEPNCLFVAGDGRKDWLHFVDLDSVDEDLLESESVQETQKQLGVEHVGKYNPLAIERERLWDNRDVDETLSYRAMTWWRALSFDEKRDASIMGKSHFILRHPETLSLDEIVEVYKWKNWL